MSSPSPLSAPPCTTSRCLFCAVAPSFTLHPYPRSKYIENSIHRVSDKFNTLFDDSEAHDVPPPALDDSTAYPATNGDHPAEAAASLPTVAPIENVSSGIEPVAPFLDQSRQDTTATLDGGGINSASVVSAAEAPISDVRQDSDSQTAAPSAETAQLSLDEVTPIKSESQLQPEGKFLSGPAATDAMTTAEDLPDAPALPDSTPKPSIETSSNPIPIDTAQSQPAVPSPQSPSNMDHEMAEAPNSGKIRSRDEDDDEGAPEAKRQKTDESLSARPEFKVPQVPQSQEQLVGNGASPGAAADSSAVQTAVNYDNWPTTQMTKPQSKFLLERVRTTKKIKVAFAFKEPVNPEALNIPHYRDWIKHPMDLSTMEEKVKTDQYSSVLDFMRDLDLIIDNSVTFNGNDHPITQAGYNMRAYFLKGMTKMPKEGAEEIPKPTKKKLGMATTSKPRRESRTNIVTAKSPTGPVAAAASPQTPWPLNSDGLPLIRRDSSSANDRPKREIHRPPPKDLPYNSVKPRKKKYQQELRFCESIITEMMKPKYAKFSYPFLKPVDPVALNIPQYLKIIKKPMDLGTIEKNLREGQYQSAKDFHSDMLLVFNNCYKFNPETDDVHKMGKQLHELFNSLWNDKAVWLAEHAPASDPQSPASVYEEEEEDDEDDNDPAEDQILAIQKQIQALNETAQALLQKKRTSPKVAGKKGSKGAKPTKPKKTSIVPPPKTVTKTKQRLSKPAPLTFAQKEEISVGISTLGDADMRKAVQIIRNGCPHLANVNDDEMEIDMDEIGDDTLRELLRFIKSVKSSKDQPDDDYEPIQAPRVPSTTKQKKNKPMGKKEQEDNIKKIQEQLTKFQANGSGSSQSPPGKSHHIAFDLPALTHMQAHLDESSEDDDSGSESEEE